MFVVIWLWVFEMVYFWQEKQVVLCVVMVFGVFICVLVVKVLVQVIGCGWLFKVEFFIVLFMFDDSCDCVLFEVLCFVVLCWCNVYDVVLVQWMQCLLSVCEDELCVLLLVGFVQLDVLELLVYVVLLVMVDVVCVLGCECQVGMVNVLLCCVQCEGIFLQLVCVVFLLWMVDRIEQDWLDQVDVVFEVSLQLVLLWLWVNCQYGDCDMMLQWLEVVGIVVEVLLIVLDVICLLMLVVVLVLLGFVDGVLLVQDLLVQQVVDVMLLCLGIWVLDVCVVLGGKFVYLFECDFSLYLFVLDIDLCWFKCIGEIFVCIGVGEYVQVCVGDVGDLVVWWDGQLFDVILLDVLCLVIGIICCQFDVLLYWCEIDIEVLVVLQVCLLDVCWMMFVFGGMLLYVICLILCEENQFQVEVFLQCMCNVGFLLLDDVFGYDFWVG